MTVLMEVKNFEARFDELSFAIESEIEDKHVPLKRFRHSLILLPQSIRRDHHHFLQESLSDMEKAGSIEKLFMHLNLYWNFFDYALLEHIIDRFGSDLLKKKMAKYVHDLICFRRTTTLNQFIKFLPGTCTAEPPPNFSKVVTKLKGDAMKYTLEDLEELRRNFCNEFRFNDFMLKLKNIKQSSIIVVWHVPSVLAFELTADVMCNTSVHSSFFEYYRIIELEVDNECILYRPQEVSNHPQAQRVLVWLIVEFKSYLECI